MTQETFKKELVFTDVKTYAAHWAHISCLINTIDIIAAREDEHFAKSLKDDVEFLRNLIKKM